MFFSVILAPRIGFSPASYSVSEGSEAAILVITTDNPAAFTDSMGALFYTSEGSAVDVSTNSGMLQMLPTMLLSTLC